MQDKASNVFYAKLIASILAAFLIYEAAKEYVYKPYIRWQWIQASNQWDEDSLAVNFKKRRNLPYNPDLLKSLERKERLGAVIRGWGETPPDDN